VPGALARLGTRTPGGRTFDLHRGDFDVDERAIAVGIRLLTAAALLGTGPKPADAVPGDLLDALPSAQPVPDR
jgi:amidohydrolase